MTHAPLTADAAGILDECVAVVEWLHDHDDQSDAHRDAYWTALTRLRALRDRSSRVDLDGVDR